jgi:ribosomal protein L2
VEVNEKMLENKTLSTQMLFETKYRFKALVTRIKNKAGRSYGQIVSPRRGSFCRHIYRFIDFKRIIFPEENGLVIRIENDLIVQHLCFNLFSSGLFVNILALQK